MQVHVWFSESGIRLSLESEEVVSIRDVINEVGARLSRVRYISIIPQGMIFPYITIDTPLPGPKCMMLVREVAKSRPVNLPQKLMAAASLPASGEEKIHAW